MNSEFLTNNYVYVVETLVILGVILLVLYIFYSLRLIGPKKK